MSHVLFFLSFAGDQNVGSCGGAVRDLLGSIANRQRPDCLRCFGLSSHGISQIYENGFSTYGLL